MRATAASTAPDVLIGRPLLAPFRRSQVPARAVIAGVGGLCLLALLMCARHIQTGGFYYDDWSLLALARFPGHAGLLHGLWLDYGQRPGQVLYYAALDRAIGADAPARLELATTTLLLEVSCLYLLLRQLSLGGGHALAIAALVLTFPFSDSVWLWGVLSLSSLAIAAFLLGVMLALRALRSDGPRALALHFASLSLFVASIVSYEVVAVAGCLAGLLYVRRAGLRRARARWALDVLVIATAVAATRALLPIDVATPSRMQSLGGMVAHAGLIASGGLRLLGAAALPIIGGLDPWVGVGALSVVLARAAALRRVLAQGDRLRADLGRWLAIAGAGALVALASWSVYVPAADHYVPSPAGTVNRMNAAAAVGLVVVVYSAAVLLVRTLARLVRLPAGAASLGVVISSLLLGGAYLGRTAVDARAWDAAAADQRRELAELHAALPRLAAGVTVYAFDAPRVVGPGVPVLDTSLDLTSAMDISYSSPGLVGVPIAGPASLTCAPRESSASGVASAYGRSYMLDVAARRVTRLGSPLQCAAARGGPIGAAAGRRR